MKKIVLIIFFVFWFTVPGIADQYKVLRVVDGDTIDISYNGKKERIRMLCVDTPESVHPDQSKNTEMGRKASEYTHKRLSGKYVSLEFEKRKRGKYGRLLAYVILDGNNFNLELVKKGWSPYYTKYGNSEKHHSEFGSAEKEARTNGLNIWALDLKQIGNQGLQCKLVRGNIKSKKFHQPGCRYFDCKNCTKAFPSRHEAIKAGYEPCGICKP
jgi:micrococcal nuclease